MSTPDTIMSYEYINPPSVDNTAEIINIFSLARDTDLSGA